MVDLPSAAPRPSTNPPLDEVVADARALGLRRIHLLAWRDLEDDEAGGSEIHAAMVSRLWAEAGLEVTMRASSATGRPERGERDGYHVVRRGSRFTVFPLAAFDEIRRRDGETDALVEIWNGMPFLSPLWWRGPRMVWLHHVHGPMWQMALPAPVAWGGNLLERRLAPPVYRRSAIVTLSPSSKDELVEELRFPSERVTVVPPGVHQRFQPGGERSASPLVVAVGRLAPVKRFPVLIRSLAQVKRRCPDLEAVIVGEGTERPQLEALREQLGASEWLHLPGRISDDELVELYRRAWVVTSASLREGWGMTLTEAAACGTAAVATRIAGHSDAVVEGTTGLLADDQRGLVDAVGAVLTDGVLRGRLSEGARAHAAALTWEATAAQTLAVLVADARRRRR